MKWNLADATDAGKVGQLTTLGSDLSVASATSHVGFNIGRINGRLLDLELSALEQNSRSILLPARGCWPRICNLPALSRAVRSRIRSQAGKAAPPPLSLKRRFSEWRSHRWCCRGRVRLKLHISENMPGQVLQQADGETLAIDKQEIETRGGKSGETLALGGIFSQKNKTGTDSVPGLGSIPGLIAFSP